eukprot:TRINITY_DN6930_c0_g1_i1.p1 TRINITY_DN6930_c0_g1~~TRINITY_DN6930_c0_g1_i1.p1  ORF type:complete len:385 (+),score=109.49 TRINITY_DN6930_c0_g1_i1:100-1254(+)
MERLRQLFSQEEAGDLVQVALENGFTSTRSLLSIGRNDMAQLGFKLGDVRRWELCMTLWHAQQPQQSVAWRDAAAESDSGVAAVSPLQLADATLWLNVLRMLGPQDKLRCRAVCRSFNVLVMEDDAWPECSFFANGNMQLGHTYVPRDSSLVCTSSEHPAWLVALVHFYREHIRHLYRKTRRLRSKKAASHDAAALPARQPEGQCNGDSGRVVAKLKATEEKITEAKIRVTYLLDVANYGASLRKAADRKSAPTTAASSRTAVPLANPQLQPRAGSDGASSATAATQLVVVPVGELTGRLRRTGGEWLAAKASYDGTGAALQAQKRVQAAAERSRRERKRRSDQSIVFNKQRRTIMQYGPVALLAGGPAGDGAVVAATAYYDVQ